MNKQELSFDIVRYFYHNNITFTGEGKTNDNTIVLYFEGDKKEIFKLLLKKYKKEIMQGKISTGTVSPTYAPELKRNAVAVH